MFYSFSRCYQETGIVAVLFATDSEYVWVTRKGMKNAKVRFSFYYSKIFTHVFTHAFTFHPRLPPTDFLLQRIFSFSNFAKGYPPPTPPEREGGR